LLCALCGGGSDGGGRSHLISRRTRPTAGGEDEGRNLAFVEGVPDGGAISSNLRAITWNIW